MTINFNKKFLLEYNPLNLTTKIHTRGYEDHTISVLYSAAGNKLRETFTNFPGEQANKIDYVGSFVFHNGTLDHINTDYGRISVSSKISNYDSIKMPKYKDYNLNKYQIDSKEMEFNRKWILYQLRNKKEFLDINIDPKRIMNRSIFYEMEKNMIKNYLDLHPEIRIKITPIKFPAK